MNWIKLVGWERIVDGQLLRLWIAKDIDDPRPRGYLPARTIDTGEICCVDDREAGWRPLDDRPEDAPWREAWETWKERLYCDDECDLDGITPHVEPHNGIVVLVNTRQAAGWGHGVPEKPWKKELRRLEDLPEDLPEALVGPPRSSAPTTKPSSGPRTAKSSTSSPRRTPEHAD